MSSKLLIRFYASSFTMWVAFSRGLKFIFYLNSSESKKLYWVKNIQIIFDLIQIISNWPYEHVYMTKEGSNVWSIRKLHHFYESRDVVVGE